MLDRMQEALGLGLKDMALLLGGLALVVSVLVIGLAGASKRRTWLFYLGMTGLIISVCIMGYGSVSRGSSQASS